MHPRAEDLFARALEMGAWERDAFLAGACGEDAELRLDVQRLLVDGELADSFFGSPEALLAAAGDDDTIDAAIVSEVEGDAVGPYKLLQKIGEGGFGTVWMAEQSEPIRRMVAVKVVKAGMDTRQVLARFEAERQALAMMDHPNIARVLDAGATGSGRPYFAMELVKGLPITEFCREQKLDTRARLELFREVCAAVNHAHQKGIIHRDLKPSNVMITLHGDQPVPKVIDFGIAKATQGKLTDNTLFTRVGQFMGTPVYMSPEQAAMSGLDVDTRSDIYSLGVMLYELLAGRPPFDPKELTSVGYDEMRRIIREDEPPKPSTRLIDQRKAATTKNNSALRTPHSALLKLPTDLDWIVMKAIDKDRTRRYETANALSKDIARHLNDEPVEAGEPSTIYKLGKFARRNKLALTAGLAVGLTVLAGSAASIWMAIVATQAKNDLEASNLKLKGANELAFERLVASNHTQGRMWLVRANGMLDQKRYLNARTMAGRALGFEGFGRAERDAAFAERYPILLKPESAEWPAAQRIVSGEFDYPMIWSRQGNTQEGIIGHLELVKRIAFNPDGSVMATAGFDKTLRLWDAASGEQIGEPLDWHEGVPWAVAFSPDGSLLASSGDGGKLVLWDWKARTSRQIQASPETVFTLAFHPDGTRLATGGYDGEIRLWDVASGEAIGSPLRGHTSFVYDLCFDPAGDRLASVGRDRTLRLWDINGEAERRHVDTSSVLRAVAFHPDGSSIATAGDNGKIKLWAVPELELATALDHSDQGVTGLSFSPDGMSLASSGNDKLIRIWQIPTASLHATLEGHQHEIEDVAFAPDGAVLASCGKDFTVRLWHVERSVGTPVRSHQLEGIRAIQYAQRGEILVASTGAGRVGIYDSGTGLKRGELVHSTEVTSFRVSPDHSLLAVACSNLLIFVWDLETSTLKCDPLKGHFGKITCLGFDPTSGHLVSGSEDKSVVLWDVGAGSELWRREHPDEVTCLDFDPKRSRFAAGNRQGSIYVWEPGNPDLQPSKILNTGKSSGIDALAFDPSGLHLAVSGTTDNYPFVRLWSATDWAPSEWSIGGEFDPIARVRSLCFARGGELLAAGDESHQVRLWELARGREVSVLNGHAGPVVGLSADPLRNRLASCSSDGTVRTWSLDPKAWNSRDHLLTAIEPPLSKWSKVPDGSQDPFNNWTDLAMGETATEGAEHYLALSRSEHPAARDGIFWRFCQSKNWSAAQFKLNQLADGTAQAERKYLADQIIADARHHLDLGQHSIARTQIDQAAIVAPDCPQVSAARAALLAESGDAAGALEALQRASAAAEKEATTHAGKQLRFEIALQHFLFLSEIGQGEQAQIIMDSILTNEDCVPAGQVVSELLDP